MRSTLHTLMDDWGNLGDGLSGSLLLGSLLDMLPSIAAILSIIWFTIRIWESETVQKFVTRRHVEQSNEEDTGSR